MRETNEEEVNVLIHQSLTGDKTAFSQLYDRTIRDVMGTVRFLLEDRTVMEDVVQEIYIEVYRSLAKFDSTRSFRSWVTGIAVRQVHNYRRKTWRLFRLLEKKQRYTSVEVEPDVANAIADKLEHQQWIEQIQELPYKYKQVIVLRYLHEYSQDEIAHILGIPVGTVKSRIHSALQKLRKKQTNATHFFGEAGERHGV
ncbi:sigma-70 family RNA polymerase sigma factor [Aneurinibacillus uraniidurans]|uniref:sigma-70 family RNA polymerase sigma factor n=1 Tax=Aneurinibacillus uraniidurans TaxID=2966586 RepID=UPI00234ABBED|nr:sigma-70 family RNA polymerase sigma factor [Aneurinibacillus sp. B1]WCN37334.1 sigma-70 family RNA polymerase sigma factor [Aneurinibacillus sp. B1]